MGRMTATDRKGTPMDCHMGVAAVDVARERGCAIISLTGFAQDNPLRTRGDLNLHVPCERYGPVEILHHSLGRCILDSILDGRSR